MSSLFSSELLRVLKTLEAIRLRIILTGTNDEIKEIEANIKSLKMLLALK